MRSRRSHQEQMAAVARRRLDLLSAELAGLRSSLHEESSHDGAADGVGSDAAGAGGSGRPDGPGPSNVVPDSDGADAAAPAVGPRPADPGLLAGSSLPGRHARRPVSSSSRAAGWVHDRLPSTLQGHVALRPGHLVVVATLVALAFAVTAWVVVRADGTGTVVPSAAPAQESTTALVEAKAGEALVEPVSPPAAAATAASPPPTVVVDVAGKVRRPGIVTLPVGARVVDAIEEAGGARRGVDLATLNLARILADGEQVVVGLELPGGVAAPAASAPATGGSGAGTLVNINTASETALEELPGVGPVTAAAIVQWRTDNGPFTAVDELMEVSGIGEATLADMAPFVTL